MHADEAHRMESLGRLAGGVAHDFNNLLGVILGYAAAVEGRVDDPRALADLGEIRQAAERASVLTRQLLTFASGGAVVHEPVDVNAVLRGAAGMLDGTAGEQVDVRFDLSAEPAIAVANRHQLEQIALNLVLNARDALPTGGVVEIATKPAPRPRGRGCPPAVVLSVRDDGVGMAPEVAARACEPFFTTKPTGEGTGLGLATVYGIVTQSEGTIAVDSTVGEGTTVTITLPGAG